MESSSLARKEEKQALGVRMKVGISLLLAATATLLAVADARAADKNMKYLKGVYTGYCDLDSTMGDNLNFSAMRLIVDSKGKVSGTAIRTLNYAGAGDLVTFGGKLKPTKQTKYWITSKANLSASDGLVVTGKFSYAKGSGGMFQGRSQEGDFLGTCSLTKP